MKLFSKYVITIESALKSKVWMSLICVYLTIYIYIIYYIYPSKVKSQLIRQLKRIYEKIISSLSYYAVSNQTRKFLMQKSKEDTTVFSSKCILSNLQHLLSSWFVFPWLFFVMRPNDVILWPEEIHFSSIWLKNRVSLLFCTQCWSKVSEKNKYKYK